MVLNHASLAATGPEEAVHWLLDLATGMRQLKNAGAVGSGVRISEHNPAGLGLAPLRAYFFHLNQRDVYVYLLQLTTQIPLLHGIDEDIADRFRGCQATGCGPKTLHTQDGEPLVFCAISKAISVGMPSESIWDRDRLTVRFEELLPNETIEEASEEVDNLTRSGHATRILERHRERARRECASGAELWEQRGDLFPHLLFGPEVEGHLNRINVLSKVMRRLTDLDASAASWSSGPTPEWICDVRTESGAVMNTPKLRETRRFTSVTGNRSVFALHASFGQGGRIHLRLDAAQQQVEIGYIGGHLPTKRFSS